MAIITSSPDAWTPLATDLRPMAEDVVLNRFEEGSGTKGLNGQDFQTIPPEIIQMIELAQIGWGAQLGTGKRIGYWSTVALIQNFLTAHIGAGVPTRGQ